MVLSEEYFMEFLRDLYGRFIDNLRILVTLRCNYHCIFCHSEGVFGITGEKLSADDYGFIAEIARKLGIRSYKITGGEPLIREDLVDIVKYIKPHADEVSLVTNGSLLLEKVGKLAEAGLDRLNVSLHALNDNVYARITGGSRLLSKVIMAIDEALRYGIRVKLNFLAMRSNIDEFLKILEFAESRGLNVNVIELIPLGVPRDVYAIEHISVSPIVNYLEKKSTSKYYRELHNRPVYVLNSGIRVEVVIGYGNYLFCSKCSRLRLTPDGYLKPCLYIESPRISIVEAVKLRDETRLVSAFKEITILRKPFFVIDGEKTCL